MVVLYIKPQAYPKKQNGGHSMDPEQQSKSIDQLQSQAVHYAQTSEYW